MSTLENGKWVAWRPDMIASVGSVLHGRNPAFVSTMVPSRDRELPKSPAASLLSEEERRAVRIVVWAAKCHTHRQATGMTLGPLPHSEAEVIEAQGIVEGIFGAPPRHEDEGVRGWSKRPM